MIFIKRILLISLTIISTFQASDIIRQSADIAFQEAASQSNFISARQGIYWGLGSGAILYLATHFFNASPDLNNIFAISTLGPGALMSEYSSIRSAESKMQEAVGAKYKEWITSWGYPPETSQAKLQKLIVDTAALNTRIKSWVYTAENSGPLVRSSLGGYAVGTIAGYAAMAILHGTAKQTCNWIKARFSIGNNNDAAQTINASDCIQA